MCSRRRFAEEELFGDRRVRESGGDELQDFELRFGKLLETSRKDAQSWTRAADEVLDRCEQRG